MRLLSCESGALPNGPAQQLADELGVDVLAPTQTLYIDPKETMFITNDKEFAAMGISTGE